MSDTVTVWVVWWRETKRDTWKPYTVELSEVDAEAEAAFGEFARKQTRITTAQLSPSDSSQ